MGLRDRRGRYLRDAPCRSRPVHFRVSVAGNHSLARPHATHDEEIHRMSDEIKIKAESRTEFGKGAARRIRREDKVPAVIYGHGNDPIHVTLPGHATMMALKHGGANALLELDIEGDEQLALTKQVQVDPIRRVLEHIDFVAVRRGEKVTVDIPVHVSGNAAPETLVVTEHSTVQVEAEATHIPEFIEVSVEGAAVGTQIHASDLSLP